MRPKPATSECWTASSASHRLADRGRITFNASTYRGPTRRGRILVQASGGPGSISTPLSELTKTGQTVTLPVWRWQPGGPGPGRGQEYTVTVPVWDWTPGVSS